MKNARMFALGFLLMAVPAARSADQAKAEPSFAGRSLSAWVGDLNDKETLVREEAIEVLTQLGPAAKVAVPALQKMLKDPAATIRLKSAIALWKIDQQTQTAAQAVTEALQGAGPRQRQEFIKTLMQLGPAAKDSAPALIECLIDPDLQVKSYALQALQQQGAAVVPALAESLDHKNFAIRHEAMEVLRRLGAGAKPAAPRLALKLKDADPLTRLLAVQALGAIDPSMEGRIPVLLEECRNSQANIRRQALQMALQLEPKPKELTAVLREELKNLLGSQGTDADRLQRVHIAQALWEIDPQDKQTLPILIEGLKDKNVAVFQQAKTVLAKMGPAARESLPAAIEVLKSRTMASFDYALADLLGRMGPGAIEPLAKLLGEEQQAVRSVAVQALGQIGTEAVPALIQALAGSDARVRLSALQGLGRIGPPAREAVPRIVETLKTADTNFQFQALTALGQIGPAAAPAVPALVELVKDKSLTEAQRWQSMRTLGLIGPAANKAIPALTETMKQDASWNIRINAAQAVWHIDRQNKEAIPTLCTALRDKDPKAVALRNTTLNLLFMMGAEAKEAVPTLADLLKEGNSPHRLMTLRTLEQIGAAAKDAEEAVKGLLNDNDVNLRMEAALTLGKIGGDQKNALPVYLDILKQPNGYLRPRLQESLVQLGPAAKEAVPLLKQVWQQPNTPPRERIKLAGTIGLLDRDEAPAMLAWLRDQRQSPSPDRTLRIQAALASWKLDPKADAVSFLVELLEEPNSNFGYLAADALAEIGPAAKPAVPGLLVLLKAPLPVYGNNPFYRQRVARALWLIDKQAVAIHVLIEQLASSDASLRFYRAQAAAVLGEIGPPAKAALPPLLEAYRSGDAALRNAAAAALQKIDPNSLAGAAAP